MNSKIIIPLAERRMTRFLWKIVQLQEGCWIVPTKRLIAAILMTGRIGFPRPLFELTEKMTAADCFLANRIPYEIPMYFICSFYPLDAQIYLTPCYALRSQNLLELYNDRFGDLKLLDELGLDYEKLISEYQSQISADFDVMDKFHGDYVEARVETNQMPHLLAAVIEAADKYNGYPVAFHSNICEHALMKLGRSTHALLALERKLLKALPNHVIPFRNLTDIVKSDAHAELKQLVMQLVNCEQKEGKTNSWDEAILLARQHVAEIGIPFESFALGDVQSIPNDSHIHILHSCVPADEVINQTIDDRAVRLHKNVCFSRCLAGNVDDIDLLVIYSSYLWLNAGNLAEMFRLLGGFPLADENIILGRASIY